MGSHLGLRVASMCALLTIVSAAHAEPPMDTRFIDAIEAIEPDPRETLFKTHYVTSNERHHGQMADLLRETGGVFIGIATDQNFVAIPALRPTHLVMVDFDQWVVDTHRVYRHVFNTRTTPEAFLAFFKPKNHYTARRELRATYPDEAVAKRVLAVHTRYHKEILLRLTEERDRLIEHGKPSYLTDQVSYDILRNLSRSGRYVSLRGDLTGERSLSTLAATLKKMNLSVGAIAFSNAEQYFNYLTNFRKNVEAMPLQDSALILRTHRYEGIQYEYYVQSASAFLEWLQGRPRAKNFNRLIKHRIPTQHRRVFTLPGRETCLDGLCPASIPCGAITYQGCCADAQLNWCLNGARQTLSCPDGCGWSDTGSMFSCGASSTPPSMVPMACP